MKFLSLFSGIGGFDLAFENAGMQSVARPVVEWIGRRIMDQHYGR